MGRASFSTYALDYAEEGRLLYAIVCPLLPLLCVEASVFFGSRTGEEGARGAVQIAIPAR